MSASRLESSSNASTSVSTTGATSGTTTRQRVVASSAVRVSLVILATLALVWSLRVAEEFLIPCAVAICVTFWLMPLVDRLHALRIPRALGAALVMLSLIGGVGVIGFLLRDDARGFAASLPKAAQHARVMFDDASHDPNGLIHHVRGVFTDRSSSPETRTRSAPLPDPIDDQEVWLRGSTTAMAAAANIVVVLFAIYLMLLSGDLFKRKLMAVVSSHAESGNLSRRRVTMEILNEIGSQFQLYLGVLAVTNVAIGFLIWAAFAMLGVEHAAVWGVAAAVLHIIPYVGPAVIALASLLVTSLQFDSLGQGLIVASTSLTIFALIGMLFSTWLAGRASNMNSVAVFVGLMFWGWLWGIWGLLLGTQFLMAMKAIADRVECLHWLSTFLCDAAKRERKVSHSKIEPSPLPAAAAIAGSGMPAIAATTMTAESASESAAIYNDTVLTATREDETRIKDAETVLDEALLPA